MLYTILRQNQTYGPYTLEQIRTMSKAGQVVDTDLAVPQAGTAPQGAAPPITVASLLQGGQSDETGGVIPYKNPQALAAYYLAVASFIPCLAIITGPIALILGLKGLKRAKAEPWVRGTVHAWIGIILGGGLGLLNLAFFLLAFLAPLLARTHGR
jgi:hypothetical protein